MYCIQYLLYTVPAIHSTCCTQYLLYTICTAHSTCCPQYVLHTVPAVQRVGAGGAGLEGATTSLGKLGGSHPGLTGGGVRGGPPGCLREGLPGHVQEGQAGEVSLPGAQLHLPRPTSFGTTPASPPSPTTRRSSPWPATSSGSRTSWSR